MNLRNRSHPDARKPQIIQGCKLFHRLQTHSILTAIVTGIECSCRTGPPPPTNRDLPAGSPNLATTEKNRQGLACWSPLLSFPATHASYEIGCKQASSASFSPIFPSQFSLRFISQSQVPRQVSSRRPRRTALVRLWSQSG